jgi:hypothetical protein
MTYIDIYYISFSVINKAIFSRIFVRIFNCKHVKDLNVGANDSCLTGQLSDNCDGYENGKILPNCNVCVTQHTRTGGANYLGLL